MKQKNTNIPQTNFLKTLNFKIFHKQKEREQ